MNPPAVKMTLSEKASHMIRKRILSGQWKAGTHFNEAAVAELLGVSRSPLRDAIKTLESEGLLETLATGRTMIIGFTPEDLVNLYELRLLLEWKAIQPLHKKGAFAFDRMVEVEKVLQRMETIPASREEYLYLDTLFHRTLVEASGNRPLLRMWSTMIQTIMALQEITNERIGQHVEAITRVHRDIFESVKRGNVKETKGLLEKHIHDGIEITSAVLEENIRNNLMNDEKLRV